MDILTFPLLSVESTPNSAMVATALELIAVGIAAVAALFAFLSGRAAKHAMQGQFFHEFLCRYSSDEMHRALHYMGEISRAKKRDEKEFLKIVTQYRENRLTSRSGASEPSEVDQARRAISHFFLTALELHDYGRGLDRRLLGILCARDGFDLLYDVVEWYEQALNPKYKRERSTRLLGLSGRDNVAELMDRRPPSADPDKP
jgi:hypothetical protein